MKQVILLLSEAASLLRHVIRTQKVP